MRIKIIRRVIMRVAQCGDYAARIIRRFRRGTLSKSTKAKKLEHVAKNRERERETKKRERSEDGGGKRRKAITAERLLNFHRLCVVNEPDILCDVLRVLKNYETRNKMPTDGTSEAKCSIFKEISWILTLQI